MKSSTCSSIAKIFYEVLGLQKVKKQAKNDFLPHFWHTESSLGRLQFWRGKWPPNLEIPLGSESRHPDLSSKLTLAPFGHLEVPQKCSQRRATHQANCSGFQPTAQQNAVLTMFDFLELIYILLVVNDVILWHFYTYVYLLEDSFMR